MVVDLSLLQSNYFIWRGDYTPVLNYNVILMVFILSRLQFLKGLQKEYRKIR